MKQLNFNVEYKKVGIQYWDSTRELSYCRPIYQANLYENNMLFITGRAEHNHAFREEVGIHLGLTINKPAWFIKKYNLVDPVTGLQPKLAWFNTTEWLIYDPDHNMITKSISTWQCKKEDSTERPHYISTLAKPSIMYNIVITKPNKIAFKETMDNTEFKRVLEIMNAIYHINKSVVTGNSKSWQWGTGNSIPNFFKELKGGHVNVAMEEGFIQGISKYKIDPKSPEFLAVIKDITRDTINIPYLEVQK